MRKIRNSNPLIQLENSKKEIAKTLRLIGIEENEFHLICDVMNGCLVKEPITTGTIWVYLRNLDYSVNNNGVDGKWNVDYDTLREKVLLFTQVSIRALHYCVQEFWGKN